MHLWRLQSTCLILTRSPANPWTCPWTLRFGSIRRKTMHVNLMSQSDPAVLSGQPKLESEQPGFCSRARHRPEQARLAKDAMGLPPGHAWQASRPTGIKHWTVWGILGPGCCSFDGQQCLRNRLVLTSACRCSRHKKHFIGKVKALSSFLTGKTLGCGSNPSFETILLVIVSV